ncbi:MAG: TM2 domain-containing protein [Butyrivibrio sp.]|nr:TM2 domain-containing protein [Butyrivibrio sp.]
MGTIRVDEDGQEWVCKEISYKLGWVDTGLVSGKKWFRVSDRDESAMFWITAMLGSFGIHKLLVGNIKAFIGYLLTCGGFGVLSCLDVLQFLSGSAGYDEVDYVEDEKGIITRIKEKVFFRRLSNRWIVPVGLVCSAVVTFISVQVIYKPVMVRINESLFTRAAEMDQGEVYGDLEVIEKMLGE